jgi:hypothetical protein
LYENSDVQDGYVLGTHTFWPAPPFSDMDWQVEPAGHEVNVGGSSFA